MAPIGVVLAGGAGRRIGGSKAMVELRGRPLIAYPLDALRAILAEVAVVVKADSELPTLSGVRVWVEPETPRHPVVGVVEALGLARERPVVVCAVDLPFVTPDVVRTLAFCDIGDAPAVVAACSGQIQPLLGRYEPAALSLLQPAARDPAEPMTELVRGLGARRLELDDPELLFNINAPDDLLMAAAMLDRRSRMTRPPPG